VSVLVDTSVWIRFLSNRAPFAAEMDSLLADDAVVGHEFVYGELLVGDRGGRQKLPHPRRPPRPPHGAAPKRPPPPQPPAEPGRVVAGVRLGTADGPLAAVADELGIAYRVEDSGCA